MPFVGSYVKDENAVQSVLSPSDSNYSVFLFQTTLIRIGGLSPGITDELSRPIDALGTSDWGKYT